MRILVVEDELIILQGLQKYLQGSGFAVDIAQTGQDAQDFVTVNQYDMIILDVNLPDCLGFELCTQLNELSTIYVPIIMLTARDEVADKIRGLDSGADDYMVKPFSYDELRARIHALLRRSHAKKNTDIIIGDVKIIPSRYVVEICGVPVFFTVKEYEILYYLGLSTPIPQSLEQIIEHVWDMDANPFSNSARVHIANIRKKIQQYSKNVEILNIKEKGYYLCIQ